MPGENVLRGLHIHQFKTINNELLPQYDFYILGSVLCPLCRADMTGNEIKQACKSIRQAQYDKKIYIQQPFYVLDNSKRFIKLIKELYTDKLIDGIIVNSPGILKCFGNDGIEIIFSRFAIRKRRRTNQYLYRYLADYNIEAFECFANDTELINDLKSFNKSKLWLREETGTFCAFSSNCLVKQYLDHCTNEPGKCASGAYELKNEKQNAIFIISGHFIFTSNSIKIQPGNMDSDSIISNAGGFEL
ncbi:MAG: hypothetical protein FIA99_14470 [Ruminiclostridium sp.]|nr:hypothetical protein [Ruminiclostridium sp.]